MVANPNETVTPIHVQAPAPMGVADIGLQNRSGLLVPYELNTTSVEGTVNITDLQSLYVDGDGPDTYGIQLNSVANGVTIFGNSSYEFWSQNYVEYTVSTRLLDFKDEVWNFSSVSALFPTNSIYRFGPAGTWNDFPYLYQGYGPSIKIGYPFTLTLYLNASTIADRPALYFNYTVSNDTFRQSSSFDYLIFNSSLGTPTQAAPTPYYQANGYHYDPMRLINDMEIDVLGNDDGDTAVFLTADATVSLQYWNATAGKMEEVPSAYNSGQDSGETSVGLLVYSVKGSTTAIVQTGPEFIGGLWNYSSPSGAEAYTLDLTPANAFLFVNLGSVENVSGAQWVPTSASGTTTFYLPTGGTYFLDFLMSDYAPVSFPETATGPLPLTVHMAADTADGVYTPLFALDNHELAEISSSGLGTAANPFILVNNENGPLAAQFAQWDIYLFPTFPGLLLADTSEWVDVTPPSFEVNIPSWERSAPYIQALGLPLTNDLQIQFYDASNISLVHAPGISGWLSVFEYGYPESSVMLWNCTSVLVAANTFDDQGNALLLYGGRNNTVWGNTFLTEPVAAANPASLDDSGEWLTGLNETESGDRVYDNFFDVPVPAITPTVDPFLCGQYGECVLLSYTDTWNVSEQSAANYQLVHGFNLTGSIVGTWYQGGNYWSNYGTTQNPYGVVPLVTPYNDSGWITSGGDHVPLVPYSLYSVTFHETGLPVGAAWNVTENGVVAASTGSSIVVQSPNGTFSLSVAGPITYFGIAPSEFTVAGKALTVSVSFVPLVALAVEAAGLSIDLEWSATINGSATGYTNVTETNDTGTITFEVTPGTYNVTAEAFDYSVAPSKITSTVGTSGAVAVFTFTLVPGSLALTVTPSSASVWLNGQSVSLIGGSALVSAAAGVDPIVATAAGYVTYYTNVSVAPQKTTFLIIKMQASPSSGLSTLDTALLVGLGVLAAVFLIGMVYFATRRRGRGPAAPPMPPQVWQQAPPAPPQVWQETPPGPPPS
jgi:thermopsin